jgi:hypothetical protein
MADPKKPPRAADAKPKDAEPVTNSDEAQAAADMYHAGVENLNAGDAEVVTGEAPAEEKPKAAPKSDD